MHPDLLMLLNEEADENGVLSYADFLRHVLYTPKVGYYQRLRPRVGRSKETDFYTARSLGKVFEMLVAASVTDLLKGEVLSDYTFIEIGAEPGQTLFEETSHPFFNTQTFALADEPVFPDKAMLFANELLDAQPFHRLIYLQGQWRELGVCINGGTLTEVILNTLTPEMQNVIECFPSKHEEGYRVDFPLEAETLLLRLVSSFKKGLFVFFDYGKSWPELIHNHPNGTARAYRNHRQHNDLLSFPGEQDITCHLCWDRLEAILKMNHFKPVTVERQESFFMRHASQTIEQIMRGESDFFKDNKQALEKLQTLIHPAFMGHSFQVLWGKRI